MIYLITILLAIIQLPVFAASAKGKKNKVQRMSPGQVARTLEKAGFPRDIVPIMTCIARYESNFNPKAVNYHNVNKTHDHGLLQINDIWKKKCKVTAQDLKNPHINARCAYKVYEQQGLTAWVTYKKFKRTCRAYKVENYNPNNFAEVIVNNRQLM